MDKKVREVIAKELLLVAKDLVASSNIKSAKLIESRSIRDEMLKLVDDVQSGRNIDDSAFAEHTDGELMAMILGPILQGVAIRLNDGKSLRRLLKKYL